MTKVKKQKIKKQQQKWLVMNRGDPIRLSADLWAEILQAKKVKWYIQNIERKKELTKDTILSKTVIQKWRRNDKFNRQTKAEEFTTGHDLQEMPKKVHQVKTKGH